MKKGIVALVLLALCLSMVTPTFADEDTFVPSIGYKNGPRIRIAELEDSDVADCLVVTSLKQAEEKSTDISQDARDLLLEVYAALSSGEMKLPIEGEYVIRELVDISWEELDCVQNWHTHQEDLEVDGVTVDIQLEMGLDAGTELLVYAYRDGQWAPIEHVDVHDDGTVTCVFEHFCPVAFAVRQHTEGSETGDTARESLILWGSLMAVSLGAMVVLVILRKKHSR